MNYTIKQVSEKTHLRPHVLRYYEREGLLPLVKRSANGIRYYSNDDLEWIGLICCLKNTGMSIKQIKGFVDLSIEGDESFARRCQMLAEHKKKVEEEIQEMYRHLEKVTCKIDHYEKEYQNYCANSRCN